MISRHLFVLVLGLPLAWLSVDFASAQKRFPVSVGTFHQEVSTILTASDGLPGNEITDVWTYGGDVRIQTDGGVYIQRSGSWVKNDGEPARDEWLSQQVAALPEDLRGLVNGEDILSVARSSDARWAVGCAAGLFYQDQTGARQLFPESGNRRWAPTQVTVDFDDEGRLWIASGQGAGRFDGNQWQLFQGRDGLPIQRLSCVCCGDGTNVWFGSKHGAIRFDGQEWYYRQGPRWLPNDSVNAISIDALNDVWIATDAGLAKIGFQRMTLAQKAEYYQEVIDAHHRRTEYEYVIEGHSDMPGRLQDLVLRSSDNDGLWTSMYGAGECFAFAATGSEKSRERAKKAFRALSFLSYVTHDAKPNPPPGFIARSIIETSSEEDPNAGPYSIENQLRGRERDKLWRVYEPRWPVSKDGKYYWKSDTSSDELDGHYFFYPLYYDLVAQTDEERAEVREIVRANIDHLIAHDLSMHDHAGRTRWAIYGPDEMNHNVTWHNERGLKSLSILAYLNVAFHMTGDAKYRQVAQDLRDNHAYHANVMWPKYQRGIGSGNQSDDEMAFMCYYNLIKYEPDEELRKMYLASFANSWRQEEPEMNPFFNFCFAALAMDQTFSSIWGDFDISPWPTWIDDSIATLQRFPLDRFDWKHDNSQRDDLILLSDHWADAFDDRVSGRGYKVNGKVIPVDERSFNHWNHDPWRLDTGSDGRTCGTGAVFTLPYYMGLYHGFIAADGP